MSETGVKPYITPGIPTIAPEASIDDVVRRLRTGIGLVAVCEDGRLLGTLSQRDLARADGLHVFGRSLRASDLLPPDVGYCFEDTEVAEAERLMRESGLERVVVLDRGGHVVGSVSLDDLTHPRSI